MKYFLLLITMIFSVNITYSQIKGSLSHKIEYDNNINKDSSGINDLVNLTKLKLKGYSF